MINTLCRSIRLLISSVFWLVGNANIKKGIEPTKQALLMAEFDVKLIDAVMQEDRFGGFGFASFQLTNNNAKIKARRQKVEAMKRLAFERIREIETNGIPLGGPADSDPSDTKRGRWLN